MKDKSGPAFPSHGSMGEVCFEGMTLRDYFANTAMLGIIRDKDRVEPLDFQGSIDKDTAEIIAENSYHMADAMLKEREKDERD